MIMNVLEAIKNIDFNFQFMSVYDSVTIDKDAVAIQKQSTDEVSGYN
jgi:hypothetical protein